MSSRRVSSTKHNQTIDTPYHQETRKPKRPKRKLGSLSTKEGTDQRFNVANFSFAKRASCSFPSQVYRNCTHSISSRPWDIWHGISRPTTIHGFENNVKFQLVCYSYWTQGGGGVSFKKIRRRSSRGADSWCINASMIDPTYHTRRIIYLSPPFLIDCYFFDFFFLLLLFCLRLRRRWWILCTPHLRESNQPSDGENQKYKGCSLLLFLHWFNQL